MIYVVCKNFAQICVHYYSSFLSVWSIFTGFLKPTVTPKMIYIIFNFPLFRHFNQSTKFGAMLDMLTDRCATMCLLATLGTFYPNWLFFFQLSMTIDISCHWIYLHTTTLQVQFSISKKATKLNGIF